MKSLFAIFDYLGSEYFQTRLNKDDLINEVFEFYLLSKSNCSKKYLQQAFRSCFNGICQHDAGFVHLDMDILQLLGRQYPVTVES